MPELYDASDEVKSDSCVEDGVYWVPAYIQYEWRAECLPEGMPKRVNLKVVVVDGVVDDIIDEDMG